MPPARPVSLDTPPMEAKRVDDLPSDPGWRFEPKWDGFRCLAHRQAAQVDLRAKSGKSLARYFPEVVALVTEAPVDGCVLDGELLIPVGKTFSFDALQARLHPAASRIERLSRETPAVYVLFDCLMADGKSLLDAPLIERREQLEHLSGAIATTGRISLTPFTANLDEARRWLAGAGGGAGEMWDGVVAKRLDAPYLPGERAMLKVKRLRTADCVVGGFRYARGSDKVGSLLLGLYDEKGLLHHIGFTSSIKAADRPALTEKLEALITPPGFTGDAPGGPSRWSTDRSADWRPLSPELVVEVAFDHVTAGRMRHGAKFIRWRPDKAPNQCRCDQLA